MNLSDFMAVWERRGYTVELARGDEMTDTAAEIGTAPDTLALIVRYSHPDLPEPPGTIKTVYCNASHDDPRWSYEEIGNRLKEEIT